MQTPNQPGQMHPEDKRNLFIFFAICIAAFVLYDIFIHQPKMKAIKEQAAQEQKVASEAPVTAAQDTSVLDHAQAIEGQARIAIDNPDLSGSLSLKGGRIDDLRLKLYFETVERETPVTLMSPARTKHPLYMDFGWLGDNITLPNADTTWQVKGGANTPLSKDNAVTLTWSNGQGLTFERSYALDEEYMFTVTQTVTNTGSAAVTLHPFTALTRQGMPADFQANAVMHEGPIAFVNGDLEEVAYKDLDDEPRRDLKGDGWAGFTDKYWFSGIVHRGEGEPSFRFLRANGARGAIYQVDMTGAPVTVAPGASVSVPVGAYVGPKKLSILNHYKEALNIPRFDLVIDFGKFWFLTIPFFHVLTWLGHATGSFAVAILVFTVMLRLAVFPLANKSYRSFARMRKIQPKMLEIREKYGEDRTKLQQAIFELYKKEQVNPMAGCLPILIQIPIFFSLYKVLYITLEMRHAPFWGWINDMSAPDPLSLFTLFGLIPWDVPAFMNIGLWPVIMGFTLWMQQRLNPPAQDPMQARVLSIMPYMLTFLMAHFPAGLVIYWSWSNMLSIIQQYVLMRQEGVEVTFFSKSSMDKKMEEAVAHGPSVHPAEEEIKHDLEAIEGKVIEKTISPPKPSKKR